MAEGQRERDAATAGAVVRVAMTNPGGADLDDDFVGRARKIGDLLVHERLGGFNQADGLHFGNIHRSREGAEKSPPHLRVSA